MISSYISKISKLYLQGNATEHSYRADLQHLLSEILGKEFSVVNEPRRQTCGAPDYIISKKEIPIGYIEAKDLKLGIDHKKNKAQYDRYKNALENLIITDYLHFEFYRNGEKKASASLGEVMSGEIVPHEQNFGLFISLVKDFGSEVSQTIKNSEKLAEMMANKALLMANVIHNALDDDDANNLNTELVQQREAFREMLIHDIDNQLFSDLYAQTIAYGLFVARYHDPTLPTFSRIEAANLIPKSNPFLRKLFQHIAGFDLDKRLDWIVDDLVNIFLASDVKDIMKNFGKSTRQEDPVIHFYETFLGKYNPALRKSRGVWYTPQPVVNFIVRAVDELLKTEFNLPLGLADTAKVKAKADFHGKKVDKEFHKVQVLDPATGTGTFLAETIRFIYEENFKNFNEGAWKSYVEKDLIPRINGFELLMASYSMAHLKLDMLLSETGYETNSDRRFNIFLTNSLEEHHKDTGTLFANWLSDESTVANQIKRDTPVMCVIGNPPYSGVSSNNGEWISRLIDVYKKEATGEKLKEQNSKYLNDDYVKFIRYSQHLIDKNGEGILAFITNNGYLDNPTFRGMRKSLLDSFNKIYIIDLHGNSKRKEITEEGMPDQNVFDIMVGVSIILAIKKKNIISEELFHYDLYGNRKDKYSFLLEKSIKGIQFTKLSPSIPFVNFFPQDEIIQKEFTALISLQDFFLKNSIGIKTGRDQFLIAANTEKLTSNLNYFINNEEKEVERKYGLRFTKSWNFESLVDQIKNKLFSDEFLTINYRPFDERVIYYNELFVDRSRRALMKNYLNPNVGIVIGRQGQAVPGKLWNLIFSTNEISDMNIFYRGGGTNFPLYLYQIPTELDPREKIPNFNPEILNKIEQQLGMKMEEVETINQQPTTDNQFTPLNLLDYIYAVLHSPNYREKYREFLKIDFPRVPYPQKETFWQLVELGAEIRKLHLLEDISNKDLSTKFPVSGDNVLEKPVFERSVILSAEQSEAVEESHQTGKVFINKTQYFENIPETSWNFYIGGYQPAQKWLKDRKGRLLDFNDILHYQKMIFALTKTDGLMKKIDTVLKTQ